MSLGCSAPFRGSGTINALPSIVAFGRVVGHGDTDRRLRSGEYLRTKSGNSADLTKRLATTAKRSQTHSVHGADVADLKTECFEHGLEHFFQTESSMVGANR